MKGIEIKPLVLGMVQTNCYIIRNPQTKEAIVIDPADDVDRIEKELKLNDLVCRGILLTHGHFDHIMVSDELRKRVKAPIYAHEQEEKLLGDPRVNASYMIGREVSIKPDVLLKDEDLIKLAGYHIKVIHTPGHTSGGACYYIMNPSEAERIDQSMDNAILISGDTLFYESIGRTDLPTGNHSQLIESIKNRLMVLEDELVVYPGHGQATTIGYERRHNIYLSPDDYL